MPKTRRAFLTEAAAAALVVATGAEAQQPQQPATPGAPPTFGAGPAIGPQVTPATFAEAEKLVQVSLRPSDRVQAAGNWRQSMAGLFERRNGPRKLRLKAEDQPATVWNPAAFHATAQDKGSNIDDLAIGGRHLDLPENADVEMIAFASLKSLSYWISSRQITSERLTKIYLARLKKYQPALKCTITLCEESALVQARAADKEIAMGHYRGPLHGIPWGAKDLLDTAGIATTWGAEFYRNRVPATDAAVVKSLAEAGAVLVAKLSLGSLALNDIWFGGQTKNPWCLEEGSSGSSAGPASAVAAGLVAFAIGSETQGSIISPSFRCGVTGLRPTYGLVPVDGAMTLSWTCDKLGPITRSVEDAESVLYEISKKDVAKEESRSSLPVKRVRVGYVAKWMAEASDVDRHALEAMKTAGMTLVPVEIPDWPYDGLNTILFAESAAAFEDITLDHRVDELTMQTPDAWPNTFRQSRFLSAVDFVQADRLRRKVAVEMARLFEGIDVLFTPSMRNEPMIIFNFTGHPALTLRAGFVEIAEARSDWAPDPKHPLPKFSPPRRVPYGVTLVGRLYDEATLCRAGAALEAELKVKDERPKGF
jgi:Asp-tRNA(Asn)/Glu-tRNA(Gln) amidotransferase A subunit family amidase